LLFTYIKSRMARDGLFLLLKSGCYRPLLHHPLLLCALLLASPGVALAAPSLETDTPLATAGYYQLQWDGADASDHELQESLHADFSDPVTLYRGADRATMLTGRPDGEYHYRLRALHQDGPGPWSQTLRVEVRHHPLSRALLFFAMGALVFLATLAAILAGNRRRGDGA
jgi:hypothetical protein